MSNILITTHIDLKDGKHILPRNSKIYDYTLEYGQLKLFIAYDNSLEGYDEYDFVFIKPNQTISVNLDEYGYVGKIEQDEGINLVFAKFILSIP